MTWVKLSEEFPDHPKVVAAGPLASWMHVCALAYCNRYLTDGFVPHPQVSKLADFSGVFIHTGGTDFAGTVDKVKPIDLADVLVAAEMWQEVEGGWVIHDYLTYQPSRAKVLADREAKARAGSAGGKKTASKRAGATALDTANAQADDEAEGAAESKPVSVSVTDTSSSSPSDSTDEGAPVQDDEEALRKVALERLADRVASVGDVFDEEAWLATDMLRARTKRLVEAQRRKEADEAQQLIDSCDRCNEKGLSETPEGFVRCEHDLEESA